MKNTNAQVLLFFRQSSRYVSNKQTCLKTTGLYEDLLLYSLFHFFYFIFSAPISFSLCFPISSSLFFYVLYQALIKHSRKVIVYIYINNMYNTYILESVNFYLINYLLNFLG